MYLCFIFDITVKGTQMFHLFDRSGIPDIDPEQVREKQQAGAVVVDVRKPLEWKEGHIPDAVHIPLGILSTRLSELDADKEIVVVCRSGHRSMMASRLLQRAGYRNVYNLSGGMMLWHRSGHPVTKA
jgi:rhodanese-related sulfurtransferase